MFPELQTDLYDPDSVENDLRHSAKGSLDAYDVTHTLAEWCCIASDFCNEMLTVTLWWRYFLGTAHIHHALQFEKDTLFPEHRRELRRTPTRTAPDSCAPSMSKKNFLLKTCTLCHCTHLGFYGFPHSFCHLVQE